MASATGEVSSRAISVGYSFNGCGCCIELIARNLKFQGPGKSDPLQQGVPGLCCSGESGVQIFICKSRRVVFRPGDPCHSFHNQIACWILLVSLGPGLCHGWTDPTPGSVNAETFHTMWPNSSKVACCSVPLFEFVVLVKAM